MGLLDRFRRRGPALTDDQRARLSRIVNPQQRQALLDALASGEEIPDYAWTPISAEIDPQALLAQVRAQFKESSAARVTQELEETADALRLRATLDTCYLAPPQECEVATQATRFTPLVVWGTFNPFGPTVNYLTLVDVPDRDEQLLLQRMLQPPMTEISVAIGLLPDAVTASVAGLMSTLRRLFTDNGTAEHPLVAGLPTHVMPPGSRLAMEHVRELFWLVAPLSSNGEDLDARTAALLRHKGDPWKRASEEIQAGHWIGQMASEDDEGKPNATQNRATSSSPTPEQFARWWTAVTDPEHVRSEQEAMTSWDGSRFVR
jgi:hypothetical protein